MTAFIPRHGTRLPQDESTRHAVVLKPGLRVQRQLYQFDFTHMSPLAILKNLPIKDDFSLQWLRVCGERVMQALDNRAKLELDHVLAEHATRKLHLLRDLSKLETALEFKLHVVDVLKFDKRVGAPAIPADYADLFRAFGLPPIAKDLMDDRVFTSMRTAGPNPVMIKRMKSLDERLPITNALFQEGVPNDSLDAALAERRLYLADYVLLEGAELSSYPNGQKYDYALLTLFVVTGPSKVCSMQL